MFLRTASKVRTLLVALAFGAVLLAGGNAAFADRLHLKDGRVLEGKVEREEGGMVYFIVKLADGKERREIFVIADEVSRIERTAAATPAPKADAPKSETPKAEPAKSAPAKSEPAKAETPKADAKSDAKKDEAAQLTGRPTRVAILNFGAPRAWQGEIEDTVGIQVNAKSWVEAIPLLKKDKVDVVVVRINSGGGYLMELTRFHRVFLDQYRPNFRTVAWVESAISAAAMSPYALREIYFMRNGSLGANTGWFGALQAVKGIELEQVLAGMEEVSRSTGRDPLIMRAMQIMQPLSATIEPSGEVRYFPDLTGEIIVNPEGRILTLTSDLAVQIKFAQGVADTKEELMQAMGITEYEWAGEAATKYIDANMRQNDTIEKRLGVLDQTYVMALQAAASLGGEQNRDLRRQEAGKAKRALAEMRKWITTNPVFELQTQRDREWFDRQEEIIKELLK